MKIILLQDILRSGGTERQTILLARAFAQAGHATEVVTFRPGGALSGTLAPVPRRCLQPFDTGMSWLAPGLAGVLRAADPDVVLCMGRMANCHAGRLRRALPRAVIIGTLRTGKKLPWLFRRSLQQVHHVVANSAESAGILIHDHPVPAERVSVIHNALVFPPAETPVRNDALRIRHGAAPGTTVLLCVGMLRPEKNQRELIEIAVTLAPGTDWQLWLAGEGDARSECEKTARRLGVDSRVKFLGFQADPTPLYQAADIAVLTSRAESLSNFLIEAQAHGLPAVAYAAGGVAECIQNKVTGAVIAPGDRPAFAGALTHYAADRGLREDAGAKARAFARTAFDPGSRASAYLNLFARLVAGAVAGGGGGGQATGRTT